MCLSRLLHQLRLHQMARRCSGDWACRCGRKWPRRSLHGLLWGLTGIVISPALRARVRALWTR